MSEQNMSSARRLLEDVWTEGNLSQLPELMADDVVAKTALASLERTWPGLASRAKSLRVARTTVPCFAVGSYRRLARFQAFKNFGCQLGTIGNRFQLAVAMNQAG